MMAFRRLTGRRASKRSRRSYRKRPSYRKRSYRRMNRTRTVFRSFLDVPFSTSKVFYNYINNNPSKCAGWHYYASSFHNFKVTGFKIQFVPRATTAPMETDQKHYNASIFISRDFGNAIWTEEDTNLINKCLSIPSTKMRMLTRPFSLYFKCGKGSPNSYHQQSPQGFLQTDDPVGTELFHIVAEKLSISSPGRFYFTYYVSFMNKRYTATPI